MIKLFRSTETNFTHNEWVLNEVISCKVIDGINSDYTLEVEYPLEDKKGISSNLVVGAIISVPAIDNRPDQLFRIISKDTSLTTITVQCQSKLLADLKENRIRPLTITGKTRKQAIQDVLNAALEPHSYTVGNLDSNTNTNVIVNIPEGSLLNALIGSENSVLSAYDGEFIINNNTINIVDTRGSDNGVVIEYGKNISSIKETTNNIDLATVLIPKSGDYRLPEYKIESTNVSAYEKRYFKEVELNLNIWDGTGTKGNDQITEQEAYTIMRNTCNKMFTVDKVDQIAFNYEVDFVELSQTEEYKNYAILETVNVGDTVLVKHKKLNLNLQGRVNKISYSINNDDIKIIDKVEVGFNRKEINDIIKDTVKQIKFAKDEIRLEVNNSITKVQTALLIQDGKISAVVQSKDGGITWELSETAFKVACLGASNSNVTIDVDGLTVNNNKIKVKNSDGDTVFYVNTQGKCNADGGFIVDDGSSTYRLDRNGLRMENENGYVSRLYVNSGETTIMADDDFEVTKTLRARDIFRCYGYAHFYAKVDFDSEDISIDNKTLREYIEDIARNI